MAVFRTPRGEIVDARGAMAGLFRQRGWEEVGPGSDVAPAMPEPSEPEPEPIDDDGFDLDDDWFRDDYLNEDTP